MNAQFADAAHVAKRSTIKKHKTGAAIYAKDGRLLSVGWSHVPSYLLRHTPWSKHAEHHAIERCHELENAHTIVIATLTRVGRLTNGRPCAACLHKIHQTGITEVIWTRSIQ